MLVNVGLTRDVAASGLSGYFTASLAQLLTAVGSTSR
jgi:hypothetical protein